MTSISKNLKMGLALGIVLLLGAGIWFWKGKKKPRPVNDVISQWAFHADSVVQLDWSAHGEKAASYERKSRDHAWQPKVNPMRIQERLNTLGDLRLESMDPPSKGPVQVILTFSDQQVWDGIFDGESFIWSSGKLEGLGAPLDEVQRRIFQEGRYAFQDHNRNWCPERIQKIKLAEKFTLTQIGLKWVIEGNRPRDADPTFVEKWLGKNCLSEADAYVDYDVIKRPSGGDTFVIEYVNKKKVEFNLVDGFKFYGEKQGIISKEFGIALAELIEAP